MTLHDRIERLENHCIQVPYMNGTASTWIIALLEKNANISADTPINPLRSVVVFLAAPDAFSAAQAT